MTAKLIDGKHIAQVIRDKWKLRVDELIKKGIRPGLGVIIVGSDPASLVYVGNKTKACESVGISSKQYDLPVTITEEELLAKIDELNNDPAINGILVQLPLPKHIDVNNVLAKISVEKDVDGFHLYNMGALVTGKMIFPPCTPYGIKCLLDYTNIDVEGKNAVVIGSSNIVGKPMALMLLSMNATVSICNIYTYYLTQYTSLADILIVATGVPGLIKKEMVKPGAVVIDVGINRLPDGRLVGDVDYEGVKEVASYITPVPGGVGPMTITMLLVNTIMAAERSNKLAKPYIDFDMA
jgi:methylenetetrahydrofolate dehydrogenase (NADP+)/methenyltetrahydrofolate cyclohydrolase